jgi:hypothetical protein
MVSNHFDMVNFLKIGELVTPPIANATTGVTYIAVTATSTTGVTPAHWHGCYVDFLAETADVYILFGETAPTVDDTATSGATVPDRLPVDQRTAWFIPPASDHKCDYYAVKCASGTAKLRARLSSY